MSYFIKDYSPPGTPPGTLMAIKEGIESQHSINLMSYTITEFQEEKLADISQCQDYFHDSPNLWIHIQGSPGSAILHNIGTLLNLHPLAMEDVSKKGQRPKMESYDDQLFVILGLATMEDDLTITTKQISLFLDKRYIVSFCDGNEDPFESIRERLRKKGNHIQSNAIDYLFYTLIDLVIDSGFPLLERVGEEIDDLEEELLCNPTSDTLLWVHQLRRGLLSLRRTLWPQREAVNGLLREEHSLISSATKIYLRDCYDHSIQLMELLEAYREITSNMLDIYLSSVSNHTNEIMRVLTIIATIFIPLTFIVGVYGMNFESNPNNPWAMPELRWHYGYPGVWLVMIAIAVLLLAFFKRRKWF
ncbi:magnesium and cobalt transporter CorA [Candidatus Nitrosoglobus terrae]|uniref:Magnesium transport protein CorA n=1 Tax=Candidatus Nitrosoglobus terrae TaxID=1630141 RepID=A0A1Q2SNF0_9GAMM|nr:magnesium/cobalt transporter CorA [Candidatus Nitrosoglobus terrae]BAW80627.1 magnesium and cobalt transporter CorA [Candidatus Nitrosoglobus terrae]